MNEDGNYIYVRYSRGLMDPLLQFNPQQQPPSNNQLISFENQALLITVKYIIEKVASLP